jgi:hypothetical protein
MKQMYPKLNDRSKLWSWLGGAMVGALVALPLPAWSLTTTQVAEKLGSIPVFTIGVLQGNNVTFLEEPIQTQDGKEVSISRIYLNPQDAAADLNQIKTDNPSLPAGVDIARISLGEVFCLSQQSESQPCDQTQSQPGEPPAFVYFPDRTQLTTAIDLLKSQGTEIGDTTPLFVPLFFTRIQMPNQQPRTVPIIYFGIEDLRRDINEAKQTTPELSNAQFDIQVTTLSRVIEQMTSQEAQGMDQIRFIPLSQPQTQSQTPTQPQGQAGSQAPAQSQPSGQ